MRKLRLFLFTLLILSVHAVTAQTKSITGTVQDQENKPVQGASVTIAGSRRGTTTDAGGKFSLSVPSSSQRIVISSIGFTTQEVNIADKTSVTISLVTGPTESLSDVVVVGYGTSRRKDLTGSVSSISSKDLTRGAITNPLQQIAGRAPGVNVNQVGSQPGSRPNVRIRGITSLSGGNDPLIVVDGVQGNLDLLDQVPPNEIESVDILKDASATAIYGSRGAPGVIIVTTKKGVSGRTTLEYNGFASVDKLANKLDMLDAAEWGQKATQWGVAASANKGANNDWYDLLTRTGYTQNHTLSFGGGGAGFSYRASLNAILQQGIVIKSSNQNYNGRLQATQKALNDKLTLTINLNSGINTTLGSPGNLGRAAFRSNLITAAYIARPTDPIYNTDGTYFNDPDVFEYLNPYAVAQTMVNEVKKQLSVRHFQI
jgi:iron complex outermembrane receptor protein